MNQQSTIEASGPAVYAAIAAVQGELAKVGISKDGVNEAQKYKFRGIDQVYSALSPLLAKHGLCVIPRMIDRTMHERTTIKEWNGQKKESVLFYVTVHAEFDFVSSLDGSSHTASTYGEAMDSGDKATNKAMSAAYKYAAFMTFAIPTEGDNDADATTHDVAPDAKGMPDHEYATLAKKANAAGVKIAALEKKYGVRDLRLIDQTQYAEAIKGLDGVIAGKAKASTNNYAQSNNSEFGEVTEADLTH